MEEGNNHINREGDFINALILLTVGIILLLNNFGYIDWNIWDTLWKFWPVVLILWGLKEISENSSFVGLLANLLGLIILVFVVIYSLAQTDRDFRRWLVAKYPIWTQILKIEPKDPPRRFSI